MQNNMQKHDDFNFVIFGATGDLTKRKLIPALYKLYKSKILGENFVITCVARRNFTNEEFADGLKKFYKKNFKDLEEKAWNKLMTHLYYFQSDFTDDTRLFVLNNFLPSIERKHGLKENRVYYLATMPNNYESIINFAKKYKLSDQKNGWKRTVIEKPFGFSYKTAKALNKIINNVFDEKQIYRIDHYLGKETVANILIFRFANTIFEPVWNRKYVDHVQITVAEDIGINGRGDYYEKTGAIRDMVQNHLFQILNTVTIDCPGVFDADNIRREKINVLKNAKVEDFVLGQYNGYREEQNVSDSSRTETFVAMKLAVNNSRWRDVPFYLRTGKNLKKKMALVYVKFRALRCITDKRLSMVPNELIIQIQPEQHIYLHFNAKKPGLGLGVGKVNMDFCYECIYGNSPEAYEKLIMDIANGDLSSFTSWEETKYAWNAVDPVIEKIESGKTNLEFYEKGSWGPAGADELIRKDGREWYYY